MNATAVKVTVGTGAAVAGAAILAAVTNLALRLFLFFGVIFLGAAVMSAARKATSS